jgi:hypothetical protein
MPRGPRHAHGRFDRPHQNRPRALSESQHYHYTPLRNFDYLPTSLTKVCSPTISLYPLRDQCGFTLSWA